jgi:hypothetical protein
LGLEEQVVLVDLQVEEQDLTIKV